MAVVYNLKGTDSPGGMKKNTRKSIRSVGSDPNTVTLEHKRG
jgi:hypothetical protein